MENNTNTASDSTKSISEMEFESKKLSFKEKISQVMIEAGERVLNKAFDANSQNIAAFLANVESYDLEFDEISGGFTSPESEFGQEFSRKEGAGNGSFRVSGFKLSMKMRDKQ